MHFIGICLYLSLLISTIFFHLSLANFKFSPFLSFPRFFPLFPYSRPSFFFFISSSFSLFTLILIFTFSFLTNNFVRQSFNLKNNVNLVRIYLHFCWLKNSNDWNFYLHCLCSCNWRHVILLELEYQDHLHTSHKYNEAVIDPTEMKHNKMSLLKVFSKSILLIGIHIIVLRVQDSHHAEAGNEFIHNFAATDDTCKSYVIFYCSCNLFSNINLITFSFEIKILLLEFSMWMFKFQVKRWPCKILSSKWLIVLVCLKKGKEKLNRKVTEKFKFWMGYLVLWSKSLQNYLFFLSVCRTYEEKTVSEL